MGHGLKSSDRAAYVLGALDALMNADVEPREQVRVFALLQIDDTEVIAGMQATRIAMELDHLQHCLGLYPLPRAGKPD